MARGKRKGKIEVEEVDKRAEKLEKHDKKYKKHVEKIKSSNEKDAKDHEDLINKIQNKFDELSKE